ncbi:guanylate kinase [Cordyceps fumosorosea ARSEF 2679]|uniref:guanylate kinase n=1 Tax=Cordyceps fumosorosea (strain ARSEF 2679) TaxID=1081104 RepID=A0A168CMU0_CORFA|nr:guanylate kinase [Cordyceps fumosorosea ARSEF 2679]OAA71570.1 guanylate kinase [Cordyceps fumosorosea ARSEF 2679]
MATENTRPIVISGPSGVGKGTLIDMLLASHPDRFTKTISHTTRPPRPGETDGNQYFFISEAEFASLVSQDAFLEHTLYSGHHYGTSSATVTDQQAKRRVVILEIDMDGARQVRDRGAVDARFVFVRPPSLEALEARLRGRGSESEGSLRRRLESAQREMAQLDSSHGLYDKVIVSDDLNKAYKELEQFVLGTATVAERAQAQPAGE